MFADHPLTFLLAVLLIPFLVGIAILIVWYIKVRNTVLTVTEEHVMLDTGIFAKKRIEIDLERIRTVEIDQTFVDRLFNCGLLKIFTAGDEPEIELAGMPRPGRLREVLRD